MLYHIGSSDKGTSTLLRRACAKLWVETDCGVGFDVCETMQGQGQTNFSAITDLAKTDQHSNLYVAIEQINQEQ
jgi:hypothetical protein